MKVFSYNKVGKKIGWNFSKIKIKKENPSGYNYYQTVINEIKENKTVMLDIGCGSGEKSIRYFSFAKHIEMVDLEDEMLNKARENLIKYYEKNDNILSKFSIKKVDCNGNLPYKDNSFDIIVARHAPKNIEEVYRVLKKGGIFISEDVDETDCLELKEVYSCGQGYANLKDGIRLKQKIINKAIELRFSKVELLNFEEIEYYKTKEDLEFLLDNTPILEGVEDYQKKIDDYIVSHCNKKGICLVRKLYAFKMIK